MTRRGRVVTGVCLFVAAASLARPAAGQVPAVPGATPRADLAEEVRRTERAFAKSMADRDHGAFTAMLAEETVFLVEPRTLRGRAEVSAAWKRYFEGPAPFSWEPERVEVLDSGTLAITTGPVRDPAGVVTGSFTSIWRREADGRWRIIFDKGCPVCPKP